MNLNQYNLTAPIEYMDKIVTPIDYLIGRFKMLGIEENVFRTISINNYFHFPHVVVLEMQGMGFNIQ